MITSNQARDNTAAIRYTTATLNRGLAKAFEKAISCLMLPHLKRDTPIAKPESTEGGRLVSILKWPEGAPLNLG